MQVCAPRKRFRPDEWDEIEPSKVVHIRDLCEHTLEIDISRALEVFGNIRDIAVIPKLRQALVEFEDIASAQEVVRRFRLQNFFIGGRPSKINFSTSEHVVKRKGPVNESVSSANNVLIFFIYDDIYPITVDVITKICKPHGRVVRIFINRKGQVLQALVEFYTLEDAVQAKRNLNGADIYSGCCTLKIEFATTNRVNVITNNEDSWDFEAQARSRNDKQSLLATPDNSRVAPQRMTMYETLLERRAQPDYIEECNMEMVPYDSMHNRRAMYSNEYENGEFRNGDMIEGPCVAMVYGLHAEKVNCDKLFNLLCIYGNILKVKFLKSKEGSAMVEMGDGESLTRIMKFLHKQIFFERTLQFQVSKQNTISDVLGPFPLADGTPSFKNFSTCRENRFKNPGMAAKNRFFSPSKTISFWNAPPHFSFDSLKEEIIKRGAVEPIEFLQLTDRDKSSSGLLQWTGTDEAINAMALFNNMSIDSELSKFPYQLKLNFSESAIRQGLNKSKSVERGRDNRRGDRPAFTKRDMF